ncbi:methyltransferase domain-containing protein [Streptomyces sp. NBC_01433]|uniref:class I SAM-dependent methyltransferase n=1 Tax=Streptomyces sp. NBC_01433 TaxID=2903864 RepID=UPI002257E312|nr:methyltransferase domain-containing protein [Streptomyces sp. NBC_01433]MCX4681292.1 methyltransferase domain-containing protein [Streptomyces sp. NBC_01433]
MKPGEWEALLYDWHNDHRLNRQRRDVSYWLDLISPNERVLVLGAGTGRVAGPLANRSRRQVTAVDLSEERLARMPRSSGLFPVCGDMRRLPLRGHHDAAVMPYSTLQLLLSAEDRQRALEETARVLAPGGHVYIDVSQNFETRAERDWHLCVAELCAETGDVRVEEWERNCLMFDHVVIEKVFRSGSEILTQVSERWVYHHVLDLEGALERAGFDLVRIDRGYGDELSPHRLIYHGRRRG